MSQYDDFYSRRSVVRCTGGMVATGQPLAVLAGLDALRAGTSEWASGALARQAAAGVDVAVESALKQGAALEVSGALGSANLALVETLADEILIGALEAGDGAAGARTAAQ